MQGCDGSILLDGTDSDPSEKDASPNLTLRAKAFQIIEDLRELVHNTCGRVVSCADIVTVAARDSVYLVTLYSLFTLLLHCMPSIIYKYCSNVAVFI